MSLYKNLNTLYLCGNISTFDTFNYTNMLSLIKYQYTIIMPVKQIMAGIKIKNWMVKYVGNYSTDNFVLTIEI